MPNVSINWLYRHTGKDRRTIEKRVDKIPRDNKGELDCGASLEAIYCGQILASDGEFIPTPEAIRQLTIVKKQEIELGMEITRKDRIPREDCEAAFNEVVQSINGALKAKRNQTLDDKTINEIFDQLREAGEAMK